MPGDQLLRRLGNLISYSDSDTFPIEQAAAALRVIERDGEIIARAALSPPQYRLVSADGTSVYPRGVIVSGGLVVTQLGRTIGIFVGSPTTADRNAGEILANDSELNEWASEQAGIWAPIINQHRYPWIESVQLLIKLKADMRNIHVCSVRDSYIDTDGLREWASNRSDIIALSGSWLDVVETQDGLIYWHQIEHTKVDIGENTVVIPESGVSSSEEEWGDSFVDHTWEPQYNPEAGKYPDSPKEWWFWNQLSITTSVLETIAEAWGCTLETILEHFSDYQGTDVELESPDEGIQSSVKTEWHITKPD